MEKQVTTQRRFRLMEEMDQGQKGVSISFGLVDEDDFSLTHWRVLIVGPNDKMYTVFVETGPEYPMKKPEVKFQSKVNFPYVD